MVWNEEYSERFDELRKNRVKTSYHKYGSIKVNATNKLYDTMQTCQMCIEKYNQTGNTEYLCDAANFLQSWGKERGDNMRLIDADALIDKTDDRYSLHEIGRRERDDIVDALEYAPTIQPAEPKRGRWIHHPEIGWGETWLCDQCGEKTTSTVMGKPRDNFCPNCGADMRTAEQIVHDAIDNTPMAEDAYPGIKERLHKAVDDMREVTNGN